jgi:phosphonate transport system substrate-binding protein
MTLTRRGFTALAALLLTTTLFSVTGCNNTPSSGTSSSGGKEDLPTATSARPERLIFGFIPSAEADKIAEDAKPMAEFLSKELGIPVETMTTTDYVGLVEAMGSKKADIGSLAPLIYVLAKDQGAADVVLKTSRKNSLTYHTMFITRADSGIKSIEQAKGKRMAFVDASSASGYLFPAAYLKSKGYEPETFFSQVVFAGAHDKAVQAVYNGDVDVAAVYDDARNKVEKTVPDVKQKVVIIGKTEEIPNDTISVRTGLDPALVKQIKDGLIKYAHSPEGKKTLYEVYEVDDLVEAQDGDYDSVREVAKSMGVQMSDIGGSKKASASPSPGASPSPSPAAPASPPAASPAPAKKP